MGLLEQKIYERNQNGNMPQFDSKSKFDDEFVQWAVKLVDPNKVPNMKQRLRIARQVTYQLLRTKRVVTRQEGRRGSLVLYTGAFLEEEAEKKRREDERELMMAAHPSTGSNVTPIRKGRAA
jgi:hypothetical protein